jgi:hypothetical protein
MTAARTRSSPPISAPGLSKSETVDGDALPMRDSSGSDTEVVMLAGASLAVTSATGVEDESPALGAAAALACVAEMGAVTVELAMRRAEGRAVVSTASSAAAVESMWEKRGCGMGVSGLGEIKAEWADAPGCVYH